LAMDTLPPKDFYGIFDRISKIIDLKGAYSAEEIRRRLQQSKYWESPKMVYSKHLKEWAHEKGDMHILIDHGFHRRVEETLLTGHSRNIIVLTILFGRDRAAIMAKAMRKADIDRKLGITAERGAVAEVARRLGIRERIFGRRRGSVWTT